MGRRTKNKKDSKRNNNNKRQQGKNSESLSQTFKQLNEVLYKQGYLSPENAYEFYVVSKEWLRLFRKNEKSKTPSPLPTINEDLLADNIYGFKEINLRNKDRTVKNRIFLDDEFEVVTDKAWNFLTSFNAGIEIKKTFYFDSDFDFREVDMDFVLNLILVKGKGESESMVLTVKRQKNFDRLLDIVLESCGLDDEEINCYLFDSRRTIEEFEEYLANGEILGRRIDDWKGFRYKHIKEHDVLIIDASEEDFDVVNEKNEDQLGLCYCCRKFKKLSFDCKCLIVSYCSIDCRYGDYIYHRDLCKLTLDYVKDMKIDLSSLDKEKKNNGVIGLTNIGNSCYFNSLIQLVKYNPAVMEGLKDNSFEGLEESSLVESGFFQFFSQLWFSKESCIKPWFLKIGLGLLQEDYLYFEQNDAHECLMSLIDKLNESNIELFKNIAKQYTGNLEVNINCTGCQNQIKKVEKFFCLSLPLIEEKLQTKALINNANDHLFLNTEQEIFNWSNNPTISNITKEMVNNSLLYLSSTDRVICFVDDCNEKLDKIFSLGSESRYQEAALFLVKSLKKQADFYLGLSFTEIKPTINKMMDIKGKICRMRLLPIKVEDEGDDFILAWELKRQIILYLLQIVEEGNNFDLVNKLLNSSNRFTRRKTVNKLLNIKEEIKIGEEPQKPKKRDFVVKDKSDNENKMTKDTNDSKPEIDKEAFDEAWSKYKSATEKHKQQIRCLEEAEEETKVVESLPTDISFTITLYNKKEKCKNCNKKGTHKCSLSNKVKLKPNSQNLIECDIEFKKNSLFPETIRNLLNEPTFKQHPVVRNKPELTLKSCLDAYFEAEPIDFSCEKCEAKKSEINNTIKDFPKTLIIQFKRFLTLFANGKIKQKKIEKYIDIEPEINLFGKKYAIKGVINHRGELNHGHYTSYGYNEDTEEWLFFDDDDVTVVKGIEEIKSKQNYLLFYDIVEETEEIN